MKHLSEREAWLYLADLWEGELVTNDMEEYFLVFPGKHALHNYGLCDGVQCLYDYRMISDTTIDSMETKIARKKELNDDSGYCWTLTRRGARARAAFCRKQAKLLERTKP